MNSFEHFRTEIDGAGIHFLHVRSPVEDALPIVLTHGWPGSFVEFLDVIGPLTDPAAHGGDEADAFHVVVPSLPGYTFSGPTNERGWHPGRVAAAWRTLMAALGYERYVAQGGDWGSFVTQQLGLADPEHCAAVHVNMLPPIPATEDIQPDEQIGLDKMNAYNEHDSGYYKEQSTKPQTIGYALDDSPVGLAAWIVEKFRTWTDPRRRSRRSLHEGSAARQPHGLLGHDDRALVGAHVLRVRARAGVGESRPVLPAEGARRVRPLPERDHVDLTPLGRGTVHALALRRHAAWRSLRRVRGARAVRPRRPRVLPEGTVTQ